MTLTATTFPGLDPLLQSGVIAVVRLTEAVRLGPAARALAAGGVGAVEVTLTTPGAIDAIADLASDQGLAGCVIGAGTVLDESAARSVIDAGARFVVSPALDPSVIRACRDRAVRSEEHTSELQSPCNLVCRLLLEKKKNIPRSAAAPSRTPCPDSAAVLP